MGALEGFREVGGENYEFSLNVTRIPDSASGVFPEEGEQETDRINSDTGVSGPFRLPKCMVISKS